MGGVNWKAWQEDQDASNGPNAKNPQSTYPSPPKKKKKVLTAQDIKQPEPSADFPDTVDD